MYDFSRILKQQLGAATGLFNTCQRDERAKRRKCDRGLLESSIHPLLIHIVPPFVEENNPVFILQMNGEAAYMEIERSLLAASKSV